MKHLFTTLFLGLSLTVFCQNQFKELNANNVLTTLRSNGTLFNKDGFDGHFIAPNIGGSATASTIFIGNLWVAGLSNDGSTHASVGSFGSVS